MQKMKGIYVTVLIAAIAILPTTGRAQSDEGAIPSVPGYPTPPACLPLTKGYIANQYVHEQIQAACAQAIGAQQEAYREKQARIAEQARIEADREQQEAANQAAIERAQQIAAEVDRKRKKDAKEAAENSPDNVCKDQATAGIVLSGINRMFRSHLESDQAPRVIDMTHIVTLQNSGGTLACHGVFLLSDGGTLEGTFTQRPNAAGEMIVLWEPGHWEPPLPPLPAAQPATTQAAASPPDAPAIVPAAMTAVPPQPLTDSFHRGLADRTAWETWFSSLSGTMQEGAAYWAAQRSLAHPGACQALADPASVQGCMDAKGRLRDSDLLRKSDPEYRQGWNSFQPLTPIQPNGFQPVTAAQSTR